MKKKPHLIIVAGPNGAGKSYLSEKKKLTKEFTADSFDFDLSLGKLMEQFEGSMNEQLHNNLHIAVGKEFESIIKSKMIQKENFSFQTNFDEISVDEHRKDFAKQGYHTKLYFLYVNSIERCCERVQERVAKGGHHVGKQVIIYKYKKGLENLDNYFHRYNHVIILDTSLNKSKPLLEISDGALLFASKHFVDVLKNHHLIHLHTFLNSQLERLE